MGIPSSLLRLAQALRKHKHSTMNSLVVLSCLVAAASASYIPALGYAGYGLGSPLGLSYGAGLRIAAPYSGISAAGVVPTQNILPRGNTVVTPAKLSYTRNADGSASGTLSYVDQNGIARNDGYVIDAAGIRFNDATQANYAQIARAPQ